MANNRLVSAAEAADLLQAYMPNKNARNWLLQDAQRNPIIPRTLRDGEPYYFLDDLAMFVSRFLNSSAQLVGVERSEAMRQRGRRDRRRGADRRQNPPVTLAAGIERRDYTRGDRRLQTQDRRTVH